MFQIGEFSRIARVTIETLRHYDAIGLLKPAKVDSKTGYRYYKPEQLQSLNQILALKAVGLSLDEVKAILAENLSVDEIRGILKAQLVLTESTIEEAKRRRQSILVLLNSINIEEAMPEYEVSLKSTEALVVASIRETIAKSEDIPQRWNELFTTVAHWMKANDLPIGIPMAFYHDEEYMIANVDTECAFTIPNRAINQIPKPDEPILLRHIEAIPYVATMVVGNFHVKVEGLKDAYVALGQWVTKNNYHIVAAPRELYYGSPATGDFTAEIQFPVAKGKSETE